MSLFLSRSRAVAPTLLLSPSLSQSNLALRPPRDMGRNMSTMGRVAVPEPDHMTKESLFVGGTALGTEL